MNSPHARAFERIAVDAANELRVYLEGLTDDEIKGARRICDKISNTNCSWQLFKLAELVNETIRDQEWLRKPPPPVADDAIAEGSRRDK